MKIILGSDHGGYEMKENLKKFLDAQGLAVEDLGCFSTDSVDYPDIAQKVCAEVLQDKNNLGILICTTGIGMSMAANKIQGIRAALCHTELEARLSREHNNANVLTLGGKILGTTQAQAIVDAFLKTKFSNETRHVRRVCMLR